MPISLYSIHRNKSGSFFRFSWSCLIIIVNFVLVLLWALSFIGYLLAATESKIDYFARIEIHGGHGGWMDGMICLLRRIKLYISGKNPCPRT